MFGSRTIRTLTALLISMTLGAMALMVLETAPVRPHAEQLAAVGPPPGVIERLIHDTAVPIQPVKWRNMIVHGSDGAPGLPERCHFVIGPGAGAKCTELWRRQLPGYHVYVPGRDFNADSIGICLVGDFSSSPPSQGQFDRLVQLTRALQRTLRLSADHIYLHSELDARSHSPGDAFPARAFNSSLLRSR